MTYVQRLPQIQLPVVELSGRTVALLLVASLHIIIIALIVERLRTTRYPQPMPPAAVVLLPESARTVPPTDPLENAAPSVPFVNIVPRAPVIDIERPTLPPDERPPATSWPEAARPGPVATEADVRIQPRQDPDHPIGRPTYPPQSIRLDESGVVVLNICIDATGRLTDVGLRSSSGYQRLDRAAISHLRKPSMRLLPGTENGMPVPMCTDLRVRFGFDTN
jgi:protein TonB